MSTNDVTVPTSTAATSAAPISTAAASLGGADTERPATQRPALVAVPTPAPTAQADDHAGADILPNRITSMPRLGRGLVWANVLADIERDNAGREAA